MERNSAVSINKYVDTSKTCFTNINIIIYKYSIAVYTGIYYQHKHKALVYIHHKDDDV